MSIRDDMHPNVGGIGEKVKTEPSVKEWTPVPGKPYLEKNSKGQLRTKIPLPNPAYFPIPWPH